MKIASIVLCAGSSGRIKSAQSKMLHSLGGKPVSYWSVKNAIAVTNAKPIVVVGFQADLVKHELSRLFPEKLQFALQEKLDGTGGAVRRAVEHLDADCTSVLVMYGDTPLITAESLHRLVMIQRKSHVPIAMFSAIAPDPAGYGRIVRHDNEQIDCIVEDLDATMVEKEIKEINPGVYVFDADFLRENIGHLTNNNAKGEFNLTDLIKMYVKNGPKHGPVESVLVPYEEIHGVNNRKQLAFAHKILNRRMIDNWMMEGTTFIDPETTYIEETVTLAQDVVIYPHVHLRGHTRVGENSVIENGSILHDTVVEKNVRVLPYCVIDNAVIAQNCQVGPFARLRPGTTLESGAKIGNFVEAKNATFHEGAKANHVSYIGDCEVGADVNIGAGTVVCNYDGVKKHHTTINAGAFIGSNSTLIAPVQVGAKSYVAAGSVISEEVPTGTLAIGRARQENKAMTDKTRTSTEARSNAVK
jgi:bifunctional UDP-N-acetylglucosamine pyrophosphorylase/glucosamine-1-phosphate N-acetyltransferase